MSLRSRPKKGSGPSEDWLKFVKTNQAKNKIRAYLTKKETEKRSEKIEEGEKLLKMSLSAAALIQRNIWISGSLRISIKNSRLHLYRLYVRHCGQVNQSNDWFVEKLTNQKSRVSEEKHSSMSSTVKSSAVRQSQLIDSRH